MDSLSLYLFVEICRFIGNLTGHLHKEIAAASTQIEVWLIDGLIGAGPLLIVWRLIKTEPGELCEVKLRSHWAPHPNIVKLFFDVILISKTQSNHNFVHVMTVLLLWHVQNCELIRLLFFESDQNGFSSQDLAHKHFVEWAPDGGHDIGNPSDTQISWISLHSYQNAMLQWMLDRHRPVNGVIIGSDHNLAFSIEKMYFEMWIVKIWSFQTVMLTGTIRVLLPFESWDPLHLTFLNMNVQQGPIEIS